MIIRNVTQEQLKQALDLVNEKYENNIQWNNYKQEGRNFRVTLKCHSSKGVGHRISHTGRNLISACWHVHGDFFDILLKLNSEAVIKSANKTIDKHGGNWQDWNIGSMIYPLYFSEACEC